MHTQRNDRRWLADQYKTAANLNARAQLHQRFSTNTYPWFQWVLDQMRLPAAAKVLEVGGGHGLLWAENHERIPAGWTIVVTDLSPGMVAQAALTLANVPNLTTAVLDTQALPFADAAFDAVVANHMLYHVLDRAAALAEIHRVLRPEGRLYAATNDTEHMGEIRNLALDACAAIGIPGLQEMAAQLTQVNAQFPFAMATTELGEVFDEVQLHLRANELVVTDPDALTDYMLSGIPGALARPVEGLLRRWVADRLAARGEVRITPRTGLFE